MMMKVFRSTDVFRMNEYPYNQEYISFKFVSGLNVEGYFYQEEYDDYNYLLFFDKDSKHLPELLAENLPEYDHLYLSNIGDDYWSVESGERGDLMSFFYRKGAKLYTPYSATWPYEHYLVEWVAANNKWDEYEKLMERWQSGNACDC